jgi:hypothetical protein
MEGHQLIVRNTRVNAWPSVPGRNQLHCIRCLLFHANSSVPIQTETKPNEEFADVTTVTSLMVRTSLCSVIHEKLIVTQLFKKFSDFMESEESPKPVQFIL